MKKRLGEFSPIGRLHSLGSFFEKYKSTSKFCAIFSVIKFIYKFWLKNGLGHTLGDFLQTHLVTLKTAFVPIQTHITYVHMVRFYARYMPNNNRLISKLRKYQELHSTKCIAGSFSQNSFDKVTLSMKEWLLSKVFLDFFWKSLFGWNSQKYLQ
jgi:hypothetical protein